MLENTREFSGSLPMLNGIIEDIDAGDRHACIIASNDEAWCWGVNATGQVGAGFAPPTNTGELPTKVVGFRRREAAPVEPAKPASVSTRYSGSMRYTLPEYDTR